MEVSPLRRPHPGERREMVDDIDFAEAFGDGSWIQHRTFDVLCARLEIFRRPSIEDAHRVAAGNERRHKVMAAKAAASCNEGTCHGCRTTSPCCGDTQAVWWIGRCIAKAK